jgi:hypothetical protein
MQNLRITESIRHTFATRSPKPCHPNTLITSPLKHRLHPLLSLAPYTQHQTRISPTDKHAMNWQRPYHPQRDESNPILLIKLYIVSSSFGSIFKQHDHKSRLHYPIICKEKKQKICVTKTQHSTVFPPWSQR